MARSRDRKFVLSYFTADDTISIYEPVLPNSGVVSLPLSCISFQGMLSLCNALLWDMLA